MADTPAPTPSLFARLVAEFTSARVLFKDCKHPREFFELMLHHVNEEGCLTDLQYARWAAKTVSDPGNDVLEAVYVAIEEAVKPYVDELEKWEELKSQVEQRGMTF